ncbi:MAG: sulfatase-like hydrolase/transferase [Saprospiraceae bacterium]|jgi:phosphoglycerol transferase MdoB-like AlkP superfamily enzyme|nr:sulfatase-like hydrolase/transferase [Saprospiraceae bacterium]
MKGKSRFNQSIYIVLLYRIGIVMVLFMLCRLLFYLYNRDLFSGIHIADAVSIAKGGLVFDLAAMFYFNILFILLSLLPLPFIDKSWYQKILKTVFFVTNSIAILTNCIDFIYYRFTLKRTTRTVFEEFSHETNKAGLGKDFVLDYWHVIVIYFILIFFMWWLYRQVSVKSIVKKKWWFYPTTLAALVLSATLAVGGIRGGFKHSTRPITLSNAGEYVQKPEHISLVLNTPFSIVRTWNNVELELIQFYSDEEVERIYSPLHHKEVIDGQKFDKKNVVIIILESWGKEAVGSYNKDLDGGTYRDYTPFFDSLMQHSLVFENSFASGRKSIDAIPSLLASIPNGQEPFVLTPYVVDSIHSLPYLLQKEGYGVSFFHGAPNGSMGFMALTKLLGINNYYGKNEYNNDRDYDGIWGIWDEPFFQYYAKTLSTFKQPFCSAIFSVSSHHPFIVPDKYKNTFPKGPIPVLECIGYTDMALRKFFETASKQDWFKNTIFVISADHATETFHQEYKNAWGEVAIPLIIYQPGNESLKGISNKIIQQIDVMPTLLRMMHYPKPFVAYGKNVLDNNSLNFAVSYGGGYRWIEDDYLLFFDGKNAKGLFNYKKDRLFQNNLVATFPEQVKKMETNVKAFIQQYNNRLIRNQLTYPR